MSPRVLFLTLMSGLAIAGCSDAQRASRDAKFSDRPAEITCWTYGVESFTGRSTGRIVYDDGGRISFVDAANNRYTTVDGECRVVYAAAS